MPPSKRPVKRPAAKDHGVDMGAPQSDDSADSESDTPADDLVPMHATTSVQRPTAASAHTTTTEVDEQAGCIIDEASGLFLQNGIDCTFLRLKSDHANRPLWISPEGQIYLEAFSPIVEQAQDFLVAISEPVSRPSLIHEYKLTPYSLYAAVSIGLDTDDIIEVLGRLSKTPVPSNIVRFIRDNTVSYGKLRLVLKRNRYYVESAYQDALQVLLKDEVIQQALHGEKAKTAEESSSSGGVVVQGKAPSRKDIQISGLDTEVAKEARKKHEERNAGSTKDAAVGAGDKSTLTSRLGEIEGELYNAIINLDQEDADQTLGEDEDRVYSFEIQPNQVEVVRRRCNHIDYPLIEEYDFHNDTSLPNLEIDLKPTTIIRPYQEKSLSKMFGNGRSRSGIIVLPCGAGKTLVGITAACTIKKSTLVLCTSAVAVEQWRSQFKLWSNVPDRSIARFTSDCKEQFAGNAGIVISTYTMVAYSGKRSYEAQKMMDFLTSVEWGFLMLDEVHVVPANVFRKVLTTIAAHTKLGLTATLVREDDKITDLNFLIGPKLYEANWLDLAKRGHIANVQCAEVWCPMTAEFYAEYLRAAARKGKLLYVMNPNKLRACQFLIEYHERRGDKIIVFSDDVYALITYAKILGKPYICGPTSQTERMRVLQNFQFNPTCNTIFLSKVGDTSIDLPEATCLIQISSHYGSRRQEAQRLGRILRAKRRNDEGFNAFFYSLVSRDTTEMYYSSKRQQFLIDQGYAFKVITGLPPKGAEAENLVYGTKSDQMKLLNDVLLVTETDFDEDIQIADDVEKFQQQQQRQKSTGVARKKARRVESSNIRSLSGADNMAYIEYSRDESRQQSKTAGERHKLFKKYLG